MKQKSGFIISILIHALILSVPVSVAVQDRIQDIELFFTLEDAQKRTEPAKKNTQIVQQIRKEEPEPAIVEKSNPPEKTPVQVEKKTIDPSLVEKAAPKPLITGPQISRHNEKETAAPAQTASLRDSEEPLETEFGLTIAPAFLHKEMPEYPMFARRLGKEGKVVLRLTIDAKGSLLNVEVTEKAGYGFTEAAIEAVRNSTFLPAKRDGKPIASRALLPISFKLRRD